jgi:hypothetical protein
MRLDNTWHSILKKGMKPHTLQLTRLLERHSRLKNKTLYEKSGAKAPLCFTESEIAPLKKRRLIPYLGNNLN